MKGPAALAAILNQGGAWHHPNAFTNQDLNIGP